MKGTGCAGTPEPDQAGDGAGTGKGKGGNGVAPVRGEQRVKLHLSSL